MPTSATASSPARRIRSSISAIDRSWTSSIRAGWIRPSWTSFSRVSRAASRRTGSKLLRTTASGVSSMMMLTPVVASKARMLRPSRPMIRPFMSSLGRAKTLTVDSAVCSDATRWIAIVRILRARSSPVLAGAAARSRGPAPWRRASRRRRRGRPAPRGPPTDVMPATRSSWVRCWSAAFSRLHPRLVQHLVALVELGAALVELAGPRSRSSSSDSEIRRSSRAISSRRDFTSSSASRRICAASDLASSIARRRVCGCLLVGLDELLVGLDELLARLRLEGVGRGLGHVGADQEPDGDADQRGRRRPR